MGAWLLAICLVGAAAEDEPYQWPLELPRILTSSFAEYRPGRFHMGIDLRTGPVGKDVYATGDGEIVRLLCSPFGYGKAVYLRLEDGHTVIFAHLDDFAPSYRSHVQREQHRRESYTVDLYPGEGAFPVSKGQLIGKSGQTGIGVPHLHWEIRDPAGVPVNPRLLGIEWPDTTAPEIRKILVEPASPDTRINGDLFPVVLELSGGGIKGQAGNPLRISGPVVFGIDVIDPENNGGTKLGVHTIKTASESNGSIFTVRHDRVSYDNDDDSGIAYHPGYMDEGRFLMQWRHPQNKAELYSHTSRDGVYDLRDGSDTITVTTQDFYGNEAQVSIEVVSVQHEELSVPSTEGKGSGQVFYDNVGEWMVVSVVFESPEPIAPVLWVNDSESDTPFIRITDTVFRTTYVPDEGNQEMALSVAHPRAGKLSPDSEKMLAHRFLVIRHGTDGLVGTVGGIKISADTDSAYGRLMLTAGQIPSKGAPGLEAVGPAYQLWPDFGPVRAPLTLAFSLPEGEESAKGLSVYREGKKRWEWIETEVEGDLLKVSTGTLGTFQIMRDEASPKIHVRTISEGDRIQPLHVISADVEDEGSGILSWSAYFNGEWLLMEYDPEQKRIEWEQDVPLPTGPGELVVKVTDRADRVTEKRIQVVVDSAN